jgi:hypothetical protein
MDTLNGYDVSVLRLQIFDRLKSFTANSLRQKIHEMRTRVDRYEGPIYLAFGENCGPGVKLRQAGLQPIGSGYFDNLVAPIESIIKILDADFVGMLQLSNLVIGRWENNDSVFNDRYNVYFHHYFHPHQHDFEKNDLSEGVRRRHIENIDIPLFIPEVMAQFEYLHAKMQYILRSEIFKYIVVRRVHGEPVESALSNQLRAALERYDARNFALRIIHSVEIKSEGFDADLHRFIAEDGERWGSTQAWRSLSQESASHGALSASRG